MDSILESSRILVPIISAIRSKCLCRRRISSSDDLTVRYLNNFLEYSNMSMDKLLKSIWIQLTKASLTSWTLSCVKRFVYVIFKWNVSFIMAIVISAYGFFWLKLLSLRSLSSVKCFLYFFSSFVAKEWQRWRFNISILSPALWKWTPFRSRTEYYSKFYFNLSFRTFSTISSYLLLLF